MRAATIIDGRIEVDERADPVPGDDEVLIRVHAAGINGADLAQRAGRYPPPAGATDVPGLECAGETADGKRVMALLPGGGQAELAVAHETHVLPVPDGMSWEEAGGFVEVFATAHDALFTQAELAAGERLLVNGAAGGVGVAAVQLGLAAGVQVTANARHHHEELRALGADTEVEGEYDVILELVGGENLTSNLTRLALKGRISVIGTGAGSRAEIDFGYLTRKRGRIHGSTLRSRTIQEKAHVMSALGAFVSEHTFRVPVEETFPLERTQAAYERFRAGNKFGKVVVCP
ncbi:MAG TPA: zinc-binding dehydrogenase [Gaiellaceae bacterium]|nr:zinc-binding dehydrogenase [Gaiellaceae bacterium]